MRFETIIAGQYLAGQLEKTGKIAQIRDDGDLILLDLHDGKKVMILLIERMLNLGDIEHHYQTNTAQGIFTIIFLWVDMFLPRDGDSLLLTDWMQALSALHGQQLFGYEIAGRDAFFFPIQLRGEGLQRRVHYGDVIRYGAITCNAIDVDLPFWRGRWFVAGFSTVGQSTIPDTVNHPLQPYYDVLGLPVDAELDSIKRAYRTLAKRYHPDMNPDDNDDARMKRLNDAYQRVMMSLI